jgi:hypothetical protein
MWITAVWVTAFVLNGFYVAALVLKSGVCVAVAFVRYVLDSDAWVAAASVLESGVWAVVVVGVTT